MRIAFVIGLTTIAAAVNLTSTAQQNSWSNDEAEQLLAQTSAECEVEMNFSRVANLASPMGLAQAAAAAEKKKESKPQNVTIIDASRSIYGGGGGGKLVDELKKVLKPDDDEPKPESKAQTASILPHKAGVSSMFGLYQGLCGNPQTGMPMGKPLDTFGQGAVMAQSGSAPMRQLPANNMMAMGGLGAGGKNFAQTQAPAKHGTEVPGAGGYQFKKGAAYSDPNPKGMAELNCQAAAQTGVGVRAGAGARAGTRAGARAAAPAMMGAFKPGYGMPGKRMGPNPLGLAQAQARAKVQVCSQAQARAKSHIAMANMTARTKQAQVIQLNQNKAKKESHHKSKDSDGTEAAQTESETVEKEETFAEILFK